MRRTLRGPGSHPAPSTSGVGRMRRVRIRAAVLEEFGQPLSVQEVELAEPKAGEALVRLVACGVCHTDLYTASGADPSGYAPCVLGHEGAGVVEKVGDGVTLARARRPRRHALRARVRRVRPLPERRARTAASRSATSRGSATSRTARRGSRAAASRAAPLHGHVDLRGVHRRCRRSRSRRSRPRRRSRAARRSRAGSRPGIGAALYTARVEPGSTCVVFGCGLVGLGAVIGARLAGAERIVAIDLSEERLAAGAAPRRDGHARRRRRHGRLDPRGDRRLRRRLHVRGDRERRGHAPGGRVRARGVGARDDDRRRGEGRDARHRPALPHHRPPRHGLVVRRREGAHAGAAARRPLARRARSTSSRCSRTASRSTRSTAASS